MSYRKFGQSVRWENGVVVQVEEHGFAREEGELFECYPVDGGTMGQAGVPVLHDYARRIQDAVENIERLVITDGVAEHECEGRAWREEMRRVHLAIARERIRVLIDLADFELDEILVINDALQRAELRERDAPPRLRLAPNVTAALLPHLVNVAPPNVRIVQSAGGIDGKGFPIERCDGAPWPNWYRPSYRVRPFRTAFNLTAECDVTTIDEDRPRAIALLAPPAGTTLRVLVDDRQRVYPSTIRITRIDAVAHATTWYPYGAGSFGAEMML